jgi:hypothetical protein
VSALNPAFAPTVGEFFARYEALSPGQQANAASAAWNKVTPLLDRQPIRVMLGQAEPTWTMRQVIDEGKVLVVSLPSGVIGPVAADLVGGVIVTMAWNAAMGRQILSREQRRPVSLVIDELPRFVRGGGASLTDILARARGHGLGLVGAPAHRPGPARPAGGPAQRSPQQGRAAARCRRCGVVCPPLARRHGPTTWWVSSRARRSRRWWSADGSLAR